MEETDTGETEMEETRIERGETGIETDETENENTKSQEEALDPAHLAALDDPTLDVSTCNIIYLLNGYTACPDPDVIPSTLYCDPIPNGSITLCAPLKIRSRFSSSPFTPSSSFCRRTSAPISVRKAFWVMGPCVDAASLKLSGIRVVCRRKGTYKRTQVLP